MEAQLDEVMVDTNELKRMILIKGRRTKRPRPPPSPLALTMAYSTSSEGGTTSAVSYDSGTGFDDASPGSSIEFTKIIQEEEDMANCLILLAQGQGQGQGEAHQRSVVRNKAGLYVYECKTCNRAFSSFQALGGHRASHKKPKLNIDEKKPKILPKVEEDFTNNNHSISLSLQINPNKAMSMASSNKSKVHECSICGAEFTSGQALGGHMRRHRAIPIIPAAMSISTTSATSNESSQEMKKSRTLLSLDLNLPAPEDHDHHRESKFPFGPKQQIIVFSTSSLVDCHF